MLPSSHFLIALVALALFAFSSTLARPAPPPKSIDANDFSLSFAITVNTSLWSPCVDTAVTPYLKPGVRSASIQVGPNSSCDNGPFEYAVIGQSGSNVTLLATFHSSVIEDASPPTVQLVWDLTDPYTQPGDMVLDSREGYHLTYYTIRLVGW